MLIFLSWSGEQSKLVAETLENWLRQVIQAVDPWISTDISKGLRWGPEIADRLERSKVGIICLSRDNLESKWILFEAGALSKTKDAYVCTLLLGLKPTDIEQPLAQFQHTTTEKEDIRQLVHTINNVIAKCGEKALPDPLLDEVFDTYWPRLEKAFENALTLKKQESKRERPDREILQEILELIRNQERRQLSIDDRDKFRDALRLSGLDRSKKYLDNNNKLFDVNDFNAMVEKLIVEERAKLKSAQQRSSKSDKSNESDPEPADFI